VKPRHVAIWLCAAFAWLAAGCHQSPPPPPPNIVLIVVDTLRADRLGVYGNARGLTPFLDQLAARGTRFAHAYAPSSWTCPSVASLFTSRFASQHGVFSFEASLSDNEVTFAERLAARGYDSAGFTANFRVAKSLGYAQGFANWREYGTGDTIKEPGATLRTDSLAWLASRPASPQPVLLYLQYMECHAPYVPPEPFLSRFARPASPAVRAAANDFMIDMRFKELTDRDVALLESLYDAETAALDDELRLLFEGLERLGVLRNAVVIVTADHGEEFREHEFLGHGLTLFEPAIRVPLIVLAPWIQGGTVVDDAVSLVDLAPTILELAGAPPEPRFMGRSLVPLFPAAAAAGAARPSQAPVRPSTILSEIQPTDDPYDLHVHRAAYLRWPQKLIVPRIGSPQLFNVIDDPQEEHPRVVHAGEPGWELYEALEEVRTAMASGAESGAPAGTPRPLDDATREKLRALGYKF
jgi:arylsulfatase A-like enzyme